MVFSGCPNKNLYKGPKSAVYVFGLKWKWPPPPLWNFPENSSDLLAWPVPKRYKRVNADVMIWQIWAPNCIGFVEVVKRSIEMGRYGSAISKNHCFGQRQAIQGRLEISGYGRALPDKPLMLDEWIRGLRSRKCEHVSAIWSAPLKIGLHPNRNISGWSRPSIYSNAAPFFYYPCAISTYL